jgi:flagellar hook assembly protein FlgD
MVTHSDGKAERKTVCLQLMSSGMGTVSPTTRAQYVSQMAQLTHVFQDGTTCTSWLLQSWEPSHCLWKFEFCRATPYKFQYWALTAQWARDSWRNECDKCEQISRVLKRLKRIVLSNPLVTESGLHTTN